MHGSGAVGWLLSALCGFVAGMSLLRARDAGGMRRRTARSEALMGLGMAAMALPGGAAGALSPLLFGVFFGALGVRELALLAAGRRFHHVHHALGALTMCYAALAAAPHSAGGGPSHPGTAGLPLVTGALLVYYAGYVLRTGMRLLPTSDGAEGPRNGGLLALPGLPDACRAAMATAMLAMLLMV
jgi:hypothetical protein